MFSLGSAAISWSSKKQPTVALSSTEAEYRGVAMATCEVAWLQKLLADLGQSEHGAIVIYCDNISRDRKSTRLNSSHSGESRMPSSA